MSLLSRKVTSDLIQEVPDNFVLVDNFYVDLMAANGSDELHFLLQQRAQSCFPLRTAQAAVYLLLLLTPPL